MKQNFKPLVREELVTIFPEWPRLEEVKENHVEIHSYIVTYLTWHDLRLPAYTEKQKQTLKWTALLHDIGKRGPPEFVGRDHTHPFVSGMIVLKIFHRLGFLQADLDQNGIQLNEANLQEVYNLIEQSVHEPIDPSHFDDDRIEGEKYCTEMHGHQHLDQIFELLWNGDVLIRGTFSEHVFRLVFFHQSLCGLSKYPAMVETDKEERLRFCDTEFLQLALVLMSNDSASYTFLKTVEVLRDFDGQFHNSHLKMMQEQYESDQEQEDPE